MLIRYVTLLPWPLICWLWMFVVHQALRDQSLTIFERNRAIPNWIVDNFAKICTRYAMLWPWPLTSWPWIFTVHCHAFKLCTNFERNRIIPGWFIDDLARVRRAILGVGHSYRTVLRSAWTKLHQTRQWHSAIISTEEICFRFHMCCCKFMDKTEGVPD